LEADHIEVYISIFPQWKCLHWALYRVSQTRPSHSSIQNIEGLAKKPIRPHLSVCINKNEWRTRKHHERLYTMTEKGKKMNTD